MTAPPARFITIPLSHYCERARWALDRVGLPYREEAHAPLFHRIATMRNAGGTVPVLVQGAERFVDSGAILRHANDWGGGDALYPRDQGLRREVDSLEQTFTLELGPHVRRWAYAHLLGETRLIREVWSRAIPPFEARLVPLLVPIARRVVRAGYRISPASAGRSLERIRGLFREVDERLRDGRSALVGDRFGAADLTFASLAAPMLFPPGCRAVLPDLDRVPEVMRSEVFRLRESAAGEFVLRVYREQRG